MNSRERFHATFEYGDPDRVFMYPQWTFGETRQRWLREGMPADVHFNTFFGYDRIETIPIHTGLIPAPESAVVEQTATWRITEDEFGGRTKTWTDREVGMPQWITYPVRDWDTWNRWKERLDPDNPTRYPEYWEHLKRSYAQRDFPLGINAGSYYGWLRNWVGMEHLALWYYDQPDLVHDMVNTVADFILRVNRRALDEIPDIDHAVMWEDMAMKAGPLISPTLFKEFMLEPMKRVTRELNDYGISLIMVDSDGNLDDLMPLWLEANVNFVYPIERAAGCDAVRYRAEYGKQLRMFGGIDKHVLRDGRTKRDIEKEVLSVAPLVDEGGFSPWVDHAVPPDVSYENFTYYMALVREVCGG